MGLLTGATSLVELILKKYGDDVAGATEELVRLGGFPESVANRIATGELPMDEASRLKRAQEQGYGPTYYHGSKGDPIYEIDPEMSGRTNSDARGTGMWMSSSPDVAGTYTGSLGEGGILYPMRSKAQDTAHVDYEGLNWNYLDPMSPVTMRDPNMKMSEGHFQGLEFNESMPEGEWYTLPAQDYDDALWDTNSVAHEAADRWHDSVLMENVVDHGGQDSFHVDIARLHPELNSMPYGSKQRHEYMRDRVSFEDKQKATEMYEARTQTPADNFVSFNPEDVRSANAAFDPEYTGSNIMGNATVPMLGATAAGSAGLLAAPMLADKDKPLPVPTMSDIVDSVTGILDVPLQGLQGLARTGYGLLSGEKFDTAANHGADVVNAGVDAGAQRFGNYTLDKTKSPEMATFAHMLALMSSPL